MSADHDAKDVPEHDVPTLLVTGGAGFVLSHVVKAFLQRAGDDSRVIVADLPHMFSDRVVRWFFDKVRDEVGGLRERVEFVHGDVTDDGFWSLLEKRYRITHILHGAAVTPTSEEERENPAASILVNQIGTLKALEFARTLSKKSGATRVQRVITVGSSAALNTPGLARYEGVGVCHENSSHNMYAISKYGIEVMSKRYRDLFGLPIACVRFSDVWGAMDRDTGARNRHNAAFNIARAVRQKRRVMVACKDIKTARMEDPLYVTDCADALARMLCSESSPQRPVYNISYGSCPLVEEFVHAAHAAKSNSSACRLEAACEVVPPNVAGADVTELPTDHHLLTSTSSEKSEYTMTNEPLCREFDWSPSPFDESWKHYLRWLDEADSIAEDNSSR